jgi:hypothetical protein
MALAEILRGVPHLMAALVAAREVAGAIRDAVWDAG